MFFETIFDIFQTFLRVGLNILKTFHDDEFKLTFFLKYFGESFNRILIEWVYLKATFIIVFIFNKIRFNYP